MEKVLYEKNDAREIFNNEVQNNIDNAERHCSPFNISCHKHQDVWGIWFNIGDDFLLANPIDLVSSIFNDDDYCLLRRYNNLNECFYINSLYMNICQRNHAFHWKTSDFTSSTEDISFSFTLDEYVNKTKECIDALYLAISNNETHAYNEYDLDLKSLELCKKQMDIKAVIPSNYVTRNEFVQEEKFHFYPIEDEYHEKYTIGFGNRKYKTYLTGWNNNFERIRHQLESYIYEESCSVILYFDLSETIVNLKHDDILDEITNIGSGCSYKYKTYSLVEVIPNESVKKPVLKGYCDEKETIKTLYEGLLRNTMRFPLEAIKGSDLPDRLVAYNMIKSPLIESFLRNESGNKGTYCTRQVHVKHILTIDPSVSQLYFDEKNVSYDNFDSLYDKDGNPFEMNEFIEWQKEIESAVIASEAVNQYEKDWKDYHQRGLELAKQLRAKLSTDFDLWYNAPFEDKSNTITEPRLIF